MRSIIRSGNVRAIRESPESHTEDWRINEAGVRAAFPKYLPVYSGK